MKKLAAEPWMNRSNCSRRSPIRYGCGCLNLLAAGEVCVCHLHEALDLPQSTVSRHLAYLRKRGLVVGRKEGLWVHYRLAKPAGELHRSLIGCLEACFKEIEALTQDRQRLEHRPCCGE